MWFIADEENVGADGKMVNACCVKCKASREMKDPQSVTMKNGRRAVKGVCPVCGTGMYKIGG
jgi:hypothetical protein